MVLCVSAAFLLSGSAVAAKAQDRTEQLSARLGALLDQRFMGTKCPGLSVVVASGNKIIFSKAIGAADVEQVVPLRPDSVHRLASLSKPITGTIIMDLVEQGRLALDAPVRTYLPELPQSYAKITPRHLLDHQSGVRGYRNAADVAFNVVHYPRSRAVLKTFVDLPLMFEPGTKVEYSSLSFTVLGAAAEAITGKSFQQLAADFFRRHGLSGFYIDDPLAIVPKRVRGYLVDANSKITFATGQVITRDYLAGAAPLGVRAAEPCTAWYWAELPPFLTVGVAFVLGKAVA
jgi:CubicO group peptidase (beta-lactamase class C family)